MSSLKYRFYPNKGRPFAFYKREKSEHSLSYNLCGWNNTNRKQWTWNWHYKSPVRNQFILKDLGRLNYFLGIKVVHSSQGIYLSQRKHALGILEESGLSRAKHLKFQWRDI